MEQIIDMIVNNGIGVACIVYFMFRDFQFMKSLTEALASLDKTLNDLNKIVEKRGDRNERV